MIGKHRVQIGDNTIRYDFVLSRNITIIRGDSGTENPSDYTESTKYLSWERYFTHVLEEHTKGTELEYHKKN